MRKLNINLPDGVGARLDAQAEAEERTVTEIVRRALDNYFEDQKPRTKESNAQ